MVMNITVSYGGKSHIFICEKEEFLEKVAKYFNIDQRYVVLYAVNKTKRFSITPSEILDLMKIEVVDARKNRGTMPLYFDVNPEPSQDLIKKVIEKLRNNTPLTGSERKELISLLERIQPLDNSLDGILGKRKSNGSSAAKKNKKVQSTNYTNSKDSFAQTDAINTDELNKVQKQAEHISQTIKKLVHNGNAENEEIQKLMDASYDDRRHFILTKMPAVAAVKDKYPLLFSLEQVKRELERQFFPGICERFISNMKKYSQHILDSCDSSNETYLRTMKSVDRAHTETQKEYAKTVGSVLILSKVLEEDFSFIHLIDNPYSSSDIYPHIDASMNSIKELFSDDIVFHIIVEEKKLCEAYDFLEAVLCLLAAFFIFYIDYPKSCRRTLIVFEKLYLNANDTVDIDDMTAQMIKMLQVKATKH